MKLSDLSIKKLVKYIIGDSEYTPYLKGSKIIELFNKVGIRDIYKFLEGGLPNRDSRTKYAEKILNKLNGTKKLEDIINEIATLEHFSLDKKLNRDVAVKEINKIISNDGYKLEKFNEKYKIIGKDIEDEIKVTPYFEEIQQVIIESCCLADK